MDFAPYQDTAPDVERALSPPPRTTSRSPQVPRTPPPNRIPSGGNHLALPNDDYFSQSQPHSGGMVHQESGHVEDRRLNIDLFETSLPIRLDYEAMLAYLLLPPAGAVFLLVVEHRSDYVR